MKKEKPLSEKIRIYGTDSEAVLVRDVAEAVKKLEEYYNNPQHQDGFGHINCLVLDRIIDKIMGSFDQVGLKDNHSPQKDVRNAEAEGNHSPQENQQSNTEGSGVQPHSEDPLKKDIKRYGGDTFCANCGFRKELHPINSAYNDCKNFKPLKIDLSRRPGKTFMTEKIEDTLKKGCGKVYSWGGYSKKGYKRKYICGEVGVKGELSLCPMCSKKKGCGKWIGEKEHLHRCGELCCKERIIKYCISCSGEEK